MLGLDLTSPQALDLDIAMMLLLNSEEKKSRDEARGAARTEKKGTKTYTGYELFLKLMESEKGKIN